MHGEGFYVASLAFVSGVWRDRARRSLTMFPQPDMEHQRPDRLREAS